MFGFSEVVGGPGAVPESVVFDVWHFGRANVVGDVGVATDFSDVSVDGRGSLAMKRIILGRRRRHLVEDMGLYGVRGEGLRQRTTGFE